MSETDVRTALPDPATDPAGCADLLAVVAAAEAYAGSPA